MLPNIAETTTNKQQSFDSMKSQTQRPHRSRDTSRAAFEASRLRAGSQRRRVYDCIVAGGPAGRTRWEIHQETGILYGSVPGQTAKLIAAGLVVETNTTRTTASGGEARVLVASEFGE